MTPLQKARSILDDLVSLANSERVILPQVRFVQTGTPVIDQEGLIVAVSELNPPQEFNLNCGAPQIGTFTILIARDCSVAFTNDGLTDHVALNKISEQQDVDGTFLWNYANTYNEFVLKQFSVGYVTEGGVAVTSMLFTIGIE